MMSKIKIGLISDTHGLLRDEVKEVLKGSDLIIHAGDVGKIEVLEMLKSIAHVYAVQGNCDKEELKKILPKNQVLEIEGNFIYVVHDIDNLDIDPEAAGFNVIVTGHSHKPSINIKNNILYFNPGSAGPRRFKLPISAGILEIHQNDLKPKLIQF